MPLPTDAIHTDVQRPCKRVWVISDGIPGHFNQSKGILLALEHLYAVEVDWLELKLKSGSFRRILRFLLNRFSISLTLFPFFYKGELPASTPDIIVGAGGRSSFAVAWLGQYFKAKNIFSGSLRGLKASLFSAVLILEQSEEPTVITMPVAPMPISQQRLNTAAQQWREQHNDTAHELWTILIGGSGAGADYQASDWLELGQQMNALAAQHNIRWLVSTSRRTGGAAEQQLRKGLDAGFIAGAVWWSDKPEPVTAAFLGLGKLVFCTVDSMSMLMESVSAMRPLIALAPEHFLPDSRYQDALDRMAGQKLMILSQINAMQAAILNTNHLLQLEVEPSVDLARKLSGHLQISSK